LALNKNSIEYYSVIERVYGKLQGGSLSHFKVQVLFQNKFQFYSIITIK
jgi:hypothetical protein